MLATGTRMRKSKAFTLIELLGVLFIVSMIFLFIALNPHYLINKEAKLDDAASFVLAQVKLMNQSAVLLQMPHRINTNQGNFILEKYLVTDNSQQWVVMDNGEEFKRGARNNALRLESSSSTITFNPNGTFVPFEITLIQEDNIIRHKISGNPSFQIVSERYEVH